MRFVLLSLVAFCLLAGPARAELRWVTLTTEAGESVKALMGLPEDGRGPYPAVIYQHGTEVRQEGYSDSGSGTDVKGFVEALVAEGYVALAPIREFERTTAVMSRGKPTGSAEQWTAAIDGGLRATSAARQFLAGQPEVKPEAIALLGFSEGGNISLWALIGQTGYRAAVLLSPAAIMTSPRYRLRAAAAEENLARITVPVFLGMTNDDLPPIRATVVEHLIPTLRSLNLKFTHRIDYPGQHSSFWKVRQDFWSDVSAFLRQHLR